MASYLRDRILVFTFEKLHVGAIGGVGRQQLELAVRFDLQLADRHVDRPATLFKRRRYVFDIVYRETDGKNTEIGA